MKSLKSYLTESMVYTIDDVKEIAPNFWKAVSQFCRDKNTEKGVEWIIDAWLNPDKFDDKNRPFTDEEMMDFEKNYMTDEAFDEIEKIS